MYGQHARRLGSILLFLLMYFLHGGFRVMVRGGPREKVSPEGEAWGKRSTKHRRSGGPQTCTYAVQYKDYPIRSYRTVPGTSR